MPKVVEMRTEPAICSIPLHQAVLRKRQHDLELPALSLRCLRE
jgi:hypothetical protein